MILARNAAVSALMSLKRVERHNGVKTCPCSATPCQSLRKSTLARPRRSALAKSASTPPMCSDSTLYVKSRVSVTQRADTDCSRDVRSAPRVSGEFQSPTFQRILRHGQQTSSALR
jgi:hypothetical protein